MSYVREIYTGLKTFMIGMKVTATYLKNANRRATASQVTTTVAYDGTPTLAREVKLSPRFRGHLHNDIERCIGCKACAKVCPIDCFWIDNEKTETNKQRISRFDIDQLKCMYCGLCVTACPTESLTMTKEWWGATFAGEGGTNLHGQLRRYGVGYFTPEQKAEVEKKRIEAAEAKKKAAAGG
ncbi:MAG: 4Fe-4S binding protein [Planctomycetota bacterium]